MIKGLKEKEKHQALREKFWCEVYVAYVGASNSTNKEGAANWADFALDEFDKRFKR